MSNLQDALTWLAVAIVSYLHKQNCNVFNFKSSYFTDLQHRTMSNHYCQGLSGSVVQCSCRGVTRLHGARGKKQVWRSRVWTWSLSEANVLYWRKYLWHCWDFLAPPFVIWRPGNCAPLATPLCWWHSICFNRLERYTNNSNTYLCGWRIMHCLKKTTSNHHNLHNSLSMKISRVRTWQQKSQGTS